MTWTLAGYLTLAVSCALIVFNVLWSTYRYKQRVSEPVVDQDWRHGISPAFQTPATRLLGKTAVGLDDREAA